MAETLELKLELDASQSIRELEKLDKELDKMKKDLKGVDKGSKAFNDLSKSIDKTEKESKQLNKQLQKNNKQVKTNTAGVNSYSKGIQGTLGQLGLMPASLGKVAGAMGGITKAAAGGSKAMKVLKIAMASTGIGLILVAVAALIQYFNSTEEGATKLKNIMAPIGILLGNVADLAADLGAAIVSAFENPKESIAKLWDFIKQNFINRITAIPDYFNGVMETIASSFKWLGSKLKIIISDIPIIGKGIDTEQAEKDMDEAFNNMIEGAKKTGKALVQMTTGISPEQWKKAGDAAGKFFKETIKETKEQIDLNNAQLALDKKRRDFKVEEAKLQTEISEERLKANDKEKYSAEERKKAIDKALALNEQLADERKAIADEELRILEIQASFSKSDADVLDAIAQKKADIILLDKTQADQARSMIMKQSSITKELEKQLKLKQDQIDADNDLASFTMPEEEEIDDIEIDTEEVVRRLEKEQEVKDYYAELDFDRQYTTFVGLKDLYDQGVIDYTEYQSRRSQLATATAQEILAGTSAMLNAISNLQDVLMKKELKRYEGNEKKQEEIRKKYADKKKKAAYAQVVIDTAQAIIGTWAGYGSAGFVGTAIAAIQTAFIVGLAAVQLATISNTEFAQGGMIFGATHAQGGIPIEVENEEAILNASAMRNPSLRNLASDINTSTGGKDFSTGDGSIKLSDESIAKIISGYNDKQVYVSEVDITETQNRVSVVEEYAEL